MQALETTGKLKEIDGYVRLTLDKLQGITIKTCLICKNKYRTSICDKTICDKTFTNHYRKQHLYPVGTVKINGVKCRALLDTGSGSSYASEGLLDYLKINPTRKEVKTIEPLTNLTTKKLKIYSVKIQDVNEKYSFNTELNKLERKVLLTLPDTKYSKILKKYPHLKEVRVNDTDEKQQLPVHIILGACDFVRSKVEKSPRVGKIGEPFGELTKMGWVMMFPGRESDVLSALYTQTSVSDYETLCSTDILGLEKSHYNHDEFVFEKFNKKKNE